MDLAERLELRASEDPIREIGLALCSPDFQTYHRAFDVAEDLAEIGASSMQRALHCVSEHRVVARLLVSLEHEGLVRRDYLRIRQLFDHENPEVQAEAARLLLRSRSRRLAERRLRSLAFTPIDDHMPLP